MITLNICLGDDDWELCKNTEWNNLESEKCNNIESGTPEWDNPERVKIQKLNIEPRVQAVQVTLGSEKLEKSLGSQVSKNRAWA